jgi:hypothetical protein
MLASAADQQIELLRSLLLLLPPGHFLEDCSTRGQYARHRASLSVKIIIIIIISSSSGGHSWGNSSRMQWCSGMLCVEEEPSRRGSRAAATVQL